VREGERVRERERHRDTERERERKREGKRERELKRRARARAIEREGQRERESEGAPERERGREKERATERYREKGDKRDKNHARHRQATVIQSGNKNQDKKKCTNNPLQSDSDRGECKYIFLRLNNPKPSQKRPRVWQEKLGREEGGQRLRSVALTTLKGPA